MLIWASAQLCYKGVVPVVMNIYRPNGHFDEQVQRAVCCPVCCPVPGPVGPQGPTGPQGIPVVRALLVLWDRRGRRAETERQEVRGLLEQPGRLVLPAPLVQLPLRWAAPVFNRCWNVLQQLIMLYPR